MVLSRKHYFHCSLSTGHASTNHVENIYNLHTASAQPPDMQHRYCTRNCLWFSNHIHHKQGEFIPVTKILSSNILFFICNTGYVTGKVCLNLICKFPTSPLVFYLVKYCVPSTSPSIFKFNILYLLLT